MNNKMLVVALLSFVTIANASIPHNDSSTAPKSALQTKVEAACPHMGKLTPAQQERVTSLMAQFTQEEADAEALTLEAKASEEEVSKKEDVKPTIATQKTVAELVAMGVEGATDLTVGATVEFEGTTYVVIATEEPKSENDKGSEEENNGSSVNPFEGQN